MSWLRSPWVLLLGAPVVGMAHFGAVYLFGEAACSNDPPRSEVLGLPLVSFVVVALTGAAALLTVLIGVVAMRRVAGPVEAAPAEPGPAGGAPERFMAFVGVLGSGVFLFTILAVGAPSLWLRPVC